MIPSAETKVVYQGDGKTTTFPFSFKYSETEDIKVSLYEIATDTTTILTKDYYIDATGGTVIYPGYAPGQEVAESERPAILDKKYRIVIYRDTEVSQPVDLGDKYPLSTLEKMHDRAIMLIQELDEIVARAVTVEAGSGEDPNHVYKDMKETSALAVASAAAAAESEKNANYSEIAAANSAAAAAESEKNAAESEANAKASEIAAANSEVNARISEENAAVSEVNAKASEGAAATSEANARASEEMAAEKAETAVEKCGEARTYAASARVSRNEAEGYAAYIMGRATPIWSADSEYNAGDVVVYENGYIYRCMYYAAPGTVPTKGLPWVKLKLVINGFMNANEGDAFKTVEDGFVAGRLEAEDEFARFVQQGDGSIIPTSSPEARKFSTTKIIHLANGDMIVSAASVWADDLDDSYDPIEDVELATDEDIDKLAAKFDFTRSDDSSSDGDGTATDDDMDKLAAKFNF